MILKTLIYIYKNFTSTSVLKKVKNWPNKKKLFYSTFFFAKWQICIILRLNEEYFNIYFSNIKYLQGFLIYLNKIKEGTI